MDMMTTKWMKYFNCCVLGDRVGKTSLILRFTTGNYVESNHDESSESQETYSTLRTVDQTQVIFQILDLSSKSEIEFGIKNYSDGYLVCFSLAEEHTLKFAKQIVEKIVNTTKSTNIFLVGTKADLEFHRISSSVPIELCKKLKLNGYFETSAKDFINVEYVFESLARGFSTKEQVELYEKQQQIEQRLEKMTIVKKLLPWNWAKVYRWDRKLRKLKSTSENSSPKGPRASLGKLEELDKEFPSFDLIPSDVWDDIEKIFGSENFSDVKLKIRDMTIPAHRIILGLRSHYFKRLFESRRNDKIFDLGDTDTLIFRELLHFCYKPSLSLSTKESLIQLKELNSIYRVVNLTETIDEKLQSLSTPSPKLVSEIRLQNSAAIQTEMSPGLREFNYLTDCSFEVGDKTFNLHKAIIGPRCQFFSTMFLSSFKESMSDSIEISSIGPEVFEKLIEYLYTGRVENFTPDICIETLAVTNMLGLKRLTQLCERAIRPLIDGENVVAICLAAEHHSAPQLVEACIFVMVRDKSSTNSPDYQQLSETTRKQVQERRIVYEEQLAIQKEHEIFLKKNIVLFSDARRLRLK